MHIYLASWIEHGTREPIFSVDAHPDSSRFATAGSDYTVKIWSLRPLEDEDAEGAGYSVDSDDEEEESESKKLNPADGVEKVPRLLATLTSHQLGVNCVRWSPSGELLASGGDDAVIMLWSLEAGTTIVFGKENIENWSPVTMLRGHTGEVTGVAWSPDGSLLATSSTDNKVIIWNVRKDSITFGKELKRLDAPEIVNGIAFDPHGSLLVSQGAGELMFWRTSDWKVEKTIKDPFDRSASTSFFYRPSWSPDSMNVAVPHVTLGGAHAAAVLHRSTGQFELSFVGHHEPTTVTSYNPQLFRGSLGDKPYAVLAVGSQDGSISVWATCSERPLAVLVGQFDGKAVTDVAWTADGMRLLAASTDGTLLYAEFDADELGLALGETERAAVISTQKKGVLARNAAIMEDPMLLSMQAKGKQLLKGTAQPAASPKKLQAPARQPSKSILELQTEVILPNGRRRIKPVFLGESGSHVPQAQHAESEPLASSSSSKVAEKAADKSFALPAAPAAKRRKQQPPAATASAPAVATASAVAVVAEEEDEASQPARGKGRPAGAAGKKKRAAASASAVSSEALVFDKSGFVKVQLDEQTVAHSSEWLPTGVRGPKTLVLDGQEEGTVRLSLDLTTLWQRALGGSLVYLCANEKFVVAMVADIHDRTCSCLVFSLFSGALVVSRFALASAPAAVSLSSGHLLFVGVNFHVSVWDLLRRKSLLQVSAAEVLRSASLSRCALLGEHNVPALVLDSGICFCYSSEMSAWFCVSDPPKHDLSEFQGSSLASAQQLLGTAAPPLALVQSIAASVSFDSLTLAASQLLASGRTADVTLSHLESQVLASGALGSLAELRYWAQLYASQLVRHLADAIEDTGARPVERTRLRALCEFLMGERGGVALADAREKRIVLREVVLPILSTNVALTSWVQKYSVELGEK